MKLLSACLAIAATLLCACSSLDNSSGGASMPAEPTIGGQPAVPTSSGP